MIPSRARSPTHTRTQTRFYVASAGRKLSGEAHFLVIKPAPAAEPTLKWMGPSVSKTMELARLSNSLQRAHGWSQSRSIRAASQSKPRFQGSVIAQIRHQ